MTKPNLPQFAKTAQIFVSKHSPEILTGVGIAGMITTTILAVKTTPKALRLIEEAKAEKGEDLTSLEKVKASWKCYIPSVTTGIFSVGCLVGANSVHARRNAALATAYKISEAAFTEYKDKVIETVGEKKEQAVRDNIAKDRMEKDPVSKSDVILTERGNTLCYDAHSGRYFKSDIEIIKRAVNQLNRQMTYDMYVSLNDFYDELGLANTDMGYQLGWNMDDGLIEVEFSSQLADDGTPCVVMSYRHAPSYGYSKLA